MNVYKLASTYTTGITSSKCYSWALVMLQRGIRLAAIMPNVATWLCSATKCPVAVCVALNAF